MRATTPTSAAPEHSTRWNKCRKGHGQLGEDIAHERPAYIGKRHVTRLCSDAYGKGVVRSNQERVNLNAYAKDNAVVAAETVRTAQTECMPGRDLVTWMEHLTGQGEKGALLTAIDVDRRNPKKWTAVMKNVAFLYGHRPRHADVWHLSPYEFVCYWEVVLARYPFISGGAR